LTNDDLVTEFIELKELFASLEISGRLIYDYKVDKVISWLEESLDFYDAENLGTLSDCATWFSLTA
jgi:hypothetical protein